MGLIACKQYPALWENSPLTDWKVKRIPDRGPSPPGDPEAGFDFLINGSYLGTGIPYAFLQKKVEKDRDTVLQREGSAGYVDYGANLFVAQNGVRVMNGNCFTCHAGEIDGKVILGIGKTIESGKAAGVNKALGNYQKSLVLPSKVLPKIIARKFGTDSKEWESFEPFSQYFQALAPQIITTNPGVNPAFRLTEACVMHRDPMSLKYQEAPRFDMIEYAIAADVPPLWHVRKKNMLYYNASGRGDFTKLLMQASVLSIPDSTAARRVHAHFKDVLAWLESLEPPKYPGAIDETLALQGRKVFEANCSKCHGTYGEQETYPNKVVSLGLVKTDPGYAQYALEAHFNDWYNQSWFAKTPPYSRMEPELGYVAPPLDGIWATAPYLHNGSVPTLEALLNSKTRPTHWKRSQDSRDYDWEKVGWMYKEKRKGQGKRTYDTTLPGYGNQGHYFGDKLTDSERSAVIEYLKTL
jgi:mono/diheme cytochrome c family protein